MLLNAARLDAEMAVLVVLPASELLGAPLVHLVDVRDVVPDAVVQVLVVLLADVLLDALLAHLVGARDAVLSHVRLLDVVMPAPPCSRACRSTQCSSNSRPLTKLCLSSAAHKHAA